MQYSHQISLRKIDETLIKSENVNIIGMNLEKMLRNYATEYDNEKYFFEYSDKKMYIKEKTKVIDRGWIYNGTSIKLVDAFIVELKKTVNTLIFKEMMSKKLKPINSQKIVKLEEPSVAFETKIIVEKTDTINDLDPIWKENPTYYFKLNKVSNLATISENIVYETKKETTKEIDVLNNIESCISNSREYINDIKSMIDVIPKYQSINEQITVLMDSFRSQINDSMDLAIKTEDLEQIKLLTEYGIEITAGNLNTSILGNNESVISVVLGMFLRRHSDFPSKVFDNALKISNMNVLKMLFNELSHFRVYLYFDSEKIRSLIESGYYKTLQLILEKDYCLNGIPFPVIDVSMMNGILQNNYSETLMLMSEHHRLEHYLDIYQDQKGFNFHHLHSCIKNNYLFVAKYLNENFQIETGFSDFALKSLATNEMYNILKIQVKSTFSKLIEDKVKTFKLMKPLDNQLPTELELYLNNVAREFPWHYPINRAINDQNLEAIKYFISIGEHIPKDIQNTLLNFGNLEIIRFFKEELDFKFSEKDIQKANEMGNYDIGEYLDTFNISAHDQLNGKLERCSYLDDCKLYSIREENKFWFERNGEIERELSDKHVETLHNRRFPSLDLVEFGDFKTYSEIATGFNNWSKFV